MLLKEIPDGCAEIFPFETVVPLRSLKVTESVNDIDGRFELYLGESLFVDKLEYVESKIIEVEAELSRYQINDNGFTNQIFITD